VGKQKKNGYAQKYRKQSRESVESVLKEKRKAMLRLEGFAEKEGFKPGMKD